MTSAKPVAPLRAVGTLSLTAISVNTIIGAGIFALPANMAQLLGAQAPLAYLTAGAAIFLIALCFAEAGSRFESSGGPYVYAREAFGEFAGFEVCWLFALARLTAMAAVANTFTDYLGFFWPDLAHGTGRFLVITALLGTLASIHVAGVRGGTWVNNAFTIGKLIPLLAFCVAGMFLLHLRAPSLASLPPAASLQQASFLLLFTLGGFENASIPSEEVIDPKKSMPIAMLGSVGLTIVVFLLIQVVATAALPELASSATPLASAARSFLGPAGGIMLTAAAALSTAGSNHGNLFAGPRLLYALGRDGHLPSRFAWIHPRFRTPAFSIIVYAVLAWILAWSSAFSQLAALAAVSRLLMYASTCLAVPFLRRRMASSPGNFRLPGGILIPVLALGVCAWLLGGTGLNQAVIVAAALLAGALLFGLMRRVNVPLRARGQADRARP